MRTIKLNCREARLLRENLTGNSEGYDYVDLCRLDALARRLTELQGPYATRMAELAREERQARRQLLRAEGNQAILEGANRALARISFDVQDLNEEAEAQQVEFVIEDGDWKLISDKLAAVNRWNASDDVRHLIIGMVEAVKNAAASEPEPAGERRLKPVS